jgi:hypothetical protein
MSKIEVAFSEFISANPAPDPAVLHRDRPNVDEVLSRAEGVSRMPRTIRSAPWRISRGWRVAVASFAIVLSVGLGTAWLMSGGDIPPIGQPDPIDIIRSDAEARATAWIDAINRGDIDTVMAMSSPEASELSDRRVHEWLAGFASNEMPTRLKGCEAIEVTHLFTTVECEIELTDAVAIELGVSDLVYPFRYMDGLLTWLPYRGGDISDVNEAYSSFLRFYHPEEYEAVCAPGAYETGSVVQDRLLALTGPCSELAAPLADEVVEWIRSGRPAPGE